MKKLKRSECEWKTCVRVGPKGWDFCSEYPNMTVIRLYNRFCVPKHSDKMRFFGVGHCLAAPRQPPPKNRRKSSQKTRRKPNLLVQKVCSEWNIKYWMHRQQKKSIDTCSQESLITNLHLNLQLVIDNFAEGMVSQTWSPHLTASISCRKAVRPLKLGVKDAPAVFILAKSTLHFLYPGFLSSQHTWIIFETVSCDQVKKPRAVFLLFLNWISLSTPLCFSWVCQLLVLYNCTHL